MINDDLWVRNKINVSCRDGVLLRPMKIKSALPDSKGRAEPCPYNLPRKKVISIKISTAPSIDGNRSKATSCKSDFPRIRRRVPRRP